VPKFELEALRSWQPLGWKLRIYQALVRVKEESCVTSRGRFGSFRRCNLQYLRFPISPFSSPAAYPHLTSNQQDDIQSDLTSILQSVFSTSEAQSSSSTNGKDASFSELLVKDLTILPGRKAWLLNLDAVVLSDAGNIHDVVFMACRAALWDTRIPRTRAVEYRSDKTGVETQDQDTEMSDIWKAAIQTKKATRAADFELEDYWDQGARLSGRSKCPVAITLNIVS
jgi:exosome complex component RRP42